MCAERGERNQNNFSLPRPWPWTSERFSLSNLHQLPAIIIFPARLACAGRSSCAGHCLCGLLAADLIGRAAARNFTPKLFLFADGTSSSTKGWRMIYEAHILDEWSRERKKIGNGASSFVSQAICRLIVLSATNRAVKLVFGR